ncbi:MAG: vWA domain-containing protein [Candidatus Limnocylindrales bacterium]
MPPLPGAAGRAARQAIDGQRLLGSAVAFAGQLRAAGLSVDLGAVIDYGRSLDLVGLADRELVREAGAAVFVRSRDQRGPYDRAFDSFWLERRRGQPMEPPTALLDEREREGREAPADRPPLPEAGSGMAGSAADRSTLEGGNAESFEALVLSPHAWSPDLVDRHRQFDRMTSAELREAERFVDLLAPNLELRRTRRRELHRRGRVLAPRAMFRRNLQTGGIPLEMVWQRPTRQPRRLVVLCDISGSMERHARLLLRFSQALAASAVRTEAFVFGTRLTRVTRLLRDRDRDAALAAVAASTTDWSGGTRIGECLRDFNRRWARRTLRSSAVVVIVSDGWDRGEPALVREEMVRLQRRCHRLVWLNPLASAPGYEPLAAGMAAALPHVDDFLPAGTLASLETLALLLSAPTTGLRSRGRGWSTPGKDPAPQPRRLADPRRPADLRRGRRTKDAPAVLAGISTASEADVSRTEEAGR